MKITSLSAAALAVLFTACDVKVTPPAPPPPVTPLPAPPPAPPPAPGKK